MEAINIPVNTAHMLAKNVHNNLDVEKMQRIMDEDENSIVELLVAKAPYYILAYGGKVLNLANFLPDSRLKTLLLWTGKAISSLAGYMHIEEK